MRNRTLWFTDSTQAWEKLNMAFLGWSSELPFIYAGHALYLYDLVIGIKNPVLDPNFDFGRHFNYTINKWKQLKANYLDLSELTELKSSIVKVNASKKAYSIPFQFKNAHNNGKQCLLSIIFSRREGKLHPTITVFMRASEVTKRLACDLLLFQRIGEFVFEGGKFDLVIHFNQIFQDDSVLLMYLAHVKDPKAVLKTILLDTKDDYQYQCNGEREKRAQYLWDKLLYFLKVEDVEEVKYKVHRRALKVLRPDLIDYPKTIAKDCKL